eukprot:TRINITY_DN11452_c0_g5_i1.p1 TRINITY_DN11452_c0_g5~~TRINITY_DN11452_c0_g5_i1.p1  ORF type:complete len:643 (+),score=144.65 TRINITY_DN11452_c0_g5_i1:56-1984(+)
MGCAPGVLRRQQMQPQSGAARHVDAFSPVLNPARPEEPAPSPPARPRSASGEAESCTVSPSRRVRRDSTTAQLVSDPSVLLHALSFLDVRQFCACRRACGRWQRAIDGAPEHLWDALLLGQFARLPRQWAARGRFGASQLLRAFALDRLSRMDATRVRVHAIEQGGPGAPESREGHAMALHEATGLLVMWGGFITDPAVYWRQLPEELKPQAISRWEMAAPRPCPVFRYGHRFSAISGPGSLTEVEFLCAGGTCQGGYHNMIWCPLVLRARRSSPAHRDWDFKWSTVQAVDRTGLAYHGQCVDEETGRVWFTGGLQDGTTLSSVFAVDVVRSEGGRIELRTACHGPSLHHANKRQSAELAGEPRPRWAHSSCVVRGRLFLCGGYTGTGMLHLQDGDNLSDVWTLELRSDALPRWRCVKTGWEGVCRPLGRAHVMCKLGDSHLVFFGGYSRPCVDLAVYDIEDNSWRVVQGGVYWQAGPPRLAHQAVSRGGAMLVWGGVHVGHGHFELDDTLIFDFDVFASDRDTPEAAARGALLEPRTPKPRSGAAAAAGRIASVVRSGQQALANLFGRHRDAREARSESESEGAGEDQCADEGSAAASLMDDDAAEDDAYDSAVDGGEDVGEGSECDSAADGEGGDYAEED